MMKPRTSNQSPIASNQVLMAYAQVFNMTHGLPPNRGHEHAISLKHGTDQLVSGPIDTHNLKKMKLKSLFRICWLLESYKHLIVLSLVLCCWLKNS